MQENKITEITSLQNENVKECAKLQIKKFRKNSGLIVLEGKKSLDGAIEAGLKIKEIFVQDKKILEDKKLNAQKIYLVNDKVMAKICSAKSPSNILATAIEPKYDFNNFKNMKKIALLDNIRDAGNLGTIIRSAAAFGMEGIILFGECADYYSAKVIRSSTGNIFKIPVIQINDTEPLIELKKTHKIISTVVNTNNSAQKHNFDLPFIIAFGSEANGICKELLKISDDKITLKMSNKVESLNLAVFAGIMFYIINSKN